jgi:hypothetical protein
MFAMVMFVGYGVGYGWCGLFRESSNFWDVMSRLKMMPSERRYMLSIERMKARMWMSEW